MKNDDDLHALRIATFYALALNSLVRNTSSKPFGLLDACAAVLARRYSDGVPSRRRDGRKFSASDLPFLGEATMDLVEGLVEGLGDASTVIKPALLTEILHQARSAHFNFTGGHALAALFSIVEAHHDAEPAKRLPPALVDMLFSAPALAVFVEGTVNGSGGCVAGILKNLVEAEPTRARELATPEITSAMCDVIALNDDAAREAYRSLALFHQYTRFSHSGYGETVVIRRSDDLRVAPMMFGLIEAGAYVGSAALLAPLVSVVVEKLRLTTIAPTPGPLLFEMRAACMRLFLKLAISNNRAILDAGGVDVVLVLLEQLKLPGSTAIARLTAFVARLTLSCLVALILSADPADEAAIRSAMLDSPCVAPTSQLAVLTPDLYSAFFRAAHS
mmetsp:Transcript_258/g.706  ORF Transcript_258/g.706 Transcript_258/m.706 type:complete len:390 (+) Transcript_258:543-1712(+)